MINFTLINLNLELTRC